jgi:hypothetical protein
MSLMLAFKIMTAVQLPCAGTASSHTAGEDGGDVYSHDTSTNPRPRPGAGVLVSTTNRPASGAASGASSSGLRAAGTSPAGAQGAQAPAAGGQTSGSSGAQSSVAALGGGPHSTSGNLADAYLEEYGERAVWWRAWRLFCLQRHLHGVCVGSPVAGKDKHCTAGGSCDGSGVQIILAGGKCLCQKYQLLVLAA